MSTTSGDMTAAFATALEGGSAPAAEASPVSTPASETPSAPAETSESPAAAIAQPETPDAPQTAITASTPEEPKNEPPKWRWQDILANTRETTAKETEARIRQEVESQYGRVKAFAELPEQEIAGLNLLYRAVNGDPTARQQIAQAAKTNPAIAQAVSGIFAAESATPDPEPEPDAAIQLEDGTRVPVYTAEGQRKRDAWLKRQLAPELSAQLRQEFAPLADAAEERRVQKAREQQWQESTQWASQVLAPVKKLPYFEEFKPQILKALSEVPKDFTGKLDDLVYDTYAQLHHAKVSGLQQTGESQALASLKQQALASTGNPSAPGVATPPTFKPGTEGFAAALAHYAGADR